MKLIDRRDYLDKKLFACIKTDSLNRYDRESISLILANNSSAL